VVFLDLLGYGALLENSYATNSENAVLQRLHTAMREAYAPIHGFPLHGEQRSWEARTFTDNTIIGFPLFLDRDAEAELALITGRVARFQFELAKHGFLVRGAIAIGEFFMDANTVFGNALLEAYRYEQSNARDPRIIMAPSAAERTKNHVKNYVNVAHSWQLNQLLYDVDGEIFLDYLEPGIMEYYDESGPDLESLARHRTMIREKLREFRTAPRNSSKIVSVAHYHNFFCHRQQDQLLDDYTVDDEQLRLHPRFIYDP
jgi:hypothetical protein